MKKIIIFTSIILLIGTPFFWRLNSNNNYETTSPTRGKAVQAVYANGEIEPVYWAKISTQISGVIDKIYVDEGEKVTKNQPLANVEDSVECSKASELVSRLSYLEKELKRYKELVSSDNASISKYELIKSEYNTVKAQIKTQNIIVDRMQIKSPISGTILKRNIELGEMATINNDIFWVGKLSPLRITANIDEEDMPLIKIGQKALIKADAFPNKNFEGTISDITPKGDPIDKNFRVRVSIEENTLLMIGMTVEINIITKEQENALLLPSSSVINGKAWLAKGTKFIEKTVKTGISNENHIQIIEGLDEKDIILLNPINYLKKK